MVLISRWKGLHLKLWNLAAANDAIEYFCNLRRSKMTVADKALEGDLLLALQREDLDEIRRLHGKGADLIASALHSAGKSLASRPWILSDQEKDASQVALRSAASCGFTRAVQFHAHRPSQDAQKGASDEQTWRKQDLPRVLVVLLSQQKSTLSTSTPLTSRGDQR